MPTFIDLGSSQELNELCEASQKIAMLACEELTGELLCPIQLLRRSYERRL